MIISPPFLPARGNDTDEAYLARAMVSPADGAYPVSHNLAWHGGLHLTAPTETTVLPVRAIADGTVAYVRKPTPMPLDPAAADAHALGYNGWTDDGVVVIRHDTEIGADDQGTATAVRFFSIYMHLGSILPAVKADETIYRKTAIGNAGFFEGQASTLHFEIICDDANLEQLIGRSTGEVALGADGRTDAVFGEMYFQLSSALQVHAARPALDQATPTGGTPLGEDLFVGIRYAGGNAEVTTYRADGTTLGAALPEAQAEYHLYRDAGAIVQAYRAAGATAVPAHSAVYELLRFGRVINTAHETLDPRRHAALAPDPHARRARLGQPQRGGCVQVQRRRCSAMDRLAPGAGLSGRRQSLRPRRASHTAGRRQRRLYYRSRGRSPPRRSCGQGVPQANDRQVPHRMGARRRRHALELADQRRPDRRHRVRAVDRPVPDPSRLPRVPALCRSAMLLGRRQPRHRCGALAFQSEGVHWAFQEVWVA